MDFEMGNPNEVEHGPKQPVNKKGVRCINERPDE
jgi:hypothetical protein